eukprot:XP_025003224.1 nucleoporin-like protein 2 [Gallus gallus]
MGTTTQTNTNIIQPAVFQHTAGGGGGSGAPAAVTQPPVIANSTSGGSGDGGGLSGASGFGPAGNNGAVLSQNAFSALSSAQPADGQRDGQQSLLDVIAEDMATWESSGQWMFSCYSPETGKPNVPGFGEFSAEEVRLEYYNCSANNNTGYYINSVNQLVQQWRKRLQELKALNGSGKSTDAISGPRMQSLNLCLPWLRRTGKAAKTTWFPGLLEQSGDLFQLLQYFPFFEIAAPASRWSSSGAVRATHWKNDWEFVSESSRLNPPAAAAAAESGCVREELPLLHEQGKRPGVKQPGFAPPSFLPLTPAAVGSLET